MKAAALIVECADGKRHAVAGESLLPLRDLAKRVRLTGEIEIGKKSIPVRSGCILASWRNGPDMVFKV